MGSISLEIEQEINKHGSATKAILDILSKKLFELDERLRSLEDDPCFK